MKKIVLFPLALLMTLCVISCDSTDNVNGKPDNGDTTSIAISTFRITSANPTTSADISFEIQTEGNVSGYLIHERKKDDDNESIIPSLTDSRWTAVKPSAYTLSDQNLYGTKVIYLFIRDSEGNLAERKSVTVCYQNKNPMFTQLCGDATGTSIIDPTIAVYGKTIYIACAASASRSTSRTACYPTVLKSTDGGSSWSTIYTSTSKAMFTSITTDTDGGLYLAMRSAATTPANRLVVLKYDDHDTSWSYLGTSTGISVDTANNVKIIAAGHDLYASCTDYGINGGAAAVYRYSSTGNQWALLGGAVASEGTASDTDMIIAKDGTIYIGYCDEGFSRKASVRRYTATGGWEYAGMRGLSADIATYTRLTETDDGIALLYRDGTLDSKPAVRIYSDGSFRNPGAVTCDGTMSSSGGEIIFCNGSLYVFFKETVGGGSLRCSCMRYSAGKWEYIGGQGFSTYSTDYLDATKEGGSIYLVFKDWGNTEAPYKYGLSLTRFY